MPIKRKYGSYWETFSRKVQGRIAFYSDLEFEHFLLVEFDDLVADFIPRPQLRGEEVGAEMLVTYRDGSRQVRAVKYSATLKRSSVCDQIAQQEEWCRANKVSHAVLTETQIRRNPIWLRNCRLLLSEVSLTKVDPTYRQLALELLRDRQPRRLYELYDSVAAGAREVLRQNLFMLFQDGVVKTDLAEHLLTVHTNFVVR